MVSERGPWGVSSLKLSPGHRPKRRAKGSETMTGPGPPARKRYRGSAALPASDQRVLMVMGCWRNVQGCVWLAATDWAPGTDKAVARTAAGRGTGWLRSQSAA